MTRIEIELYADRLSRHAERLRDDLEGARMRLGWLRLESRAREQLGVRDCAVLEALGVLTSSDEAAERRLVDRRLRQLEVVERFQALVEAELEGLAGAEASSRSWAPARPAARRPRHTPGTGRPARPSRGPLRCRSISGWSSLRTPHSITTDTGLASALNPLRPKASTSGFPSSSPSP